MAPVIYIFVMALVTYLVRMLPFTLMRRQIQSPFLRSFMYYIPYAVLAAMTIPAIFYSTSSRITAIIGTVVAFAAAFFDLPLIAVALAAAGGAFITSFLI